jgi:hypothetical protein
MAVALLCLLLLPCIPAYLYPFPSHSPPLSLATLGRRNSLHLQDNFLQEIASYPSKRLIDCRRSYEQTRKSIKDNVDFVIYFPNNVTSRVDQVNKNISSKVNDFLSTVKSTKRRLTIIATSISSNTKRTIDLGYEIYDKRDWRLLLQRSKATSGAMEEIVTIGEKNKLNMRPYSPSKPSLFYKTKEVIYSGVDALFQIPGTLKQTSQNLRSIARTAYQILTFQGPRTYLSTVNRQLNILDSQGVKRIVDSMWILLGRGEEIETRIKMRLENQRKLEEFRMERMRGKDTKKSPVRKAIETLGNLRSEIDGLKVRWQENRLKQGLVFSTADVKRSSSDAIGYTIPDLSVDWDSSGLISESSTTISSSTAFPFAFESPGITIPLLQNAASNMDEVDENVTSNTDEVSTTTTTTPTAYDDSEYNYESSVTYTENASSDITTAALESGSFGV